MGYRGSVERRRVSAQCDGTERKRRVEKHKNADGSLDSTEYIQLEDGEVSDEEILRLHHLDPNKWDVHTYTNNVWDAQDATDGRIQMYQSKLTARPKRQVISIEDIDRYMSERRFADVIPYVKPLQYDPNGEVLEIDLPDFHGGLLAWIQETGEDYDIHIAKDLFFRCLGDIINRCNGRKFKKIVFVTLGDLIHIDNDNQTTTKGTFQQVDGRFAKISDTIMDMLIGGILSLKKIAPVHVIYLAGNHDRITGRMLMMAVCQAFRTDDEVTFDMAPNPQKHFTVGKCLIGLNHGDMPIKNEDKWLQVHAREDWGKCEFAEVHKGHIHSQRVKEGYVLKDNTIDQGGVIIRTLPVICNASYWEHQQGYVSAAKAMMCFVWNPNTGLREMWYSCV